MSTIAIFSASNQEMRAYLDSRLQDIDWYEKEIQEYDPSEIIDRASIEIVSSFTDSEWTSDTIALFPNLRAIATQSTGYDHIDIEYCKKQGIAVYNVPAYGAITVAEYTWALLLALARRIPEGEQAVQADGNFSRRGSKELQGFDLAGKSIAVIGVGKIGHNVIHRANAFGMKIFAYDLYPDRALEDEYHLTWASSVAEAVRSSDIITIHLPYNKHTHHLINQEIFQAMNPQSIFINTSRGEVVDSFALKEALDKGILAQVALDVLEDEYALESGEPGKMATLNQELIADPRVLVTPHNAFNTKEALERIYQATVESIQSLLDKQAKEDDVRRVV
ncbi:MAG: NAD(P)-dependent oxidoreductase [Patescibacteria group bacterium]